MQKIESTSNEEKPDDPNKMRLVSKKLLDDFIACVEVLKKIYDYDIDFNKLKSIINSSPISNGIYIIYLKSDFFLYSKPIIHRFRT